MVRQRDTNRLHSERKYIGLFTAKQEKNTSAFDYLAEILIGTAFAGFGGVLCYYQIQIRADEIRKFGAADFNAWGFAVSIAMVIIGLFLSHAGIIFMVVASSRGSRKVLREFRKEDSCER
jgi:hypothetical protein